MFTWLSQANTFESASDAQEKAIYKLHGSLRNATLTASILPVDATACNKSDLFQIVFRVSQMTLHDDALSKPTLDPTP